jgi:hypothetical protein
MKKRLLVSFSGGRTSAYMLWWLLNEWHFRHEWEIVVCFANTGKEAEGTLEFVQKCGEAWRIDIIWLEYSANSDKGWSVLPIVVDFKSASRNGEPFERMIEKVGIPTVKTPFCSTLLKERLIRTYVRDTIGWDFYWGAIGIRSDEIDRMNENFRELRLLYPLVTMNPKMKPDILEWWSKQDFNLDIDPDEGNCDGCWKKDIMTLTRLAIKKPKIFDWWQQITDKYGGFNPRNVKLKPPFNFYRGNLSPKDIIILSKLPVNEIRKMATREKLDGCSESCEAFSDPNPLPITD